METITVPKTEYQKLIEKALRYEYLAKIVKEKENIFAAPPTRNIKEIIESFRATNLYSQSFLKSLEKGLKRSSYFRYENSSPAFRNSKVLKAKRIREKV